MPEMGTAARWCNAAEKVGLALERITGAWCVLCFAVMTLSALLGVFFRYVMQSPFMWTEEAARYLLVWMGFAAVSIALRRGRHIRIELLPKLAPAKLVRWIDFGVDALIAYFFIILFRQGYLMTVNSLMSAATIPISMKWVLAAVPVGAGLTLIQLALIVIKRAAALFPPSDDGDPAGGADQSGEPSGARLADGEG